jgi:hypothetical protein
VKNLHFEQNVQPVTRQNDVALDDGSGAQFTPADFFKEAGTIIAACLGLGLLMQVLLG